MRSVYDIVRTTTFEVVIRDAGGDGPYRSVTNDAERVVKELVGNFGNRRIFYYDSQGDYGELVHENGRFKTFAPAQE